MAFPWNLIAVRARTASYFFHSHAHARRAIQHGERPVIACDPCGRNLALMFLDFLDLAILRNGLNALMLLDVKGSSWSWDCPVSGIEVKS